MAFPSDYNWKLDITTDSTKVDSNETDFPYYFDLSNISSTDFWNNVQADGGDLRVSSDASGSTQLPLEVVSIDTGAQTGQIWFKDSTDSASNKTYYLWWEDRTGTVSQPAASATFGSQNVWNSNFQLEYHLEGNATDSTSNANNGTLTNSPTTVTGQIGDGLEFNATDQYINNCITSFTPAAFTILLWMNKDATTSQTFVSTRDASATGLEFGNSVNNIFIRMEGDTLITSGGVFSTATWTRVAAVFTGTNRFLYVNGSQVATDAYSTALTSGGDLEIARREFSPVYYGGDLDEIQILNADLSSGWLGTEYNMQNSNSTFWTEGTPENIGPVEKSTTFSVDTNIKKLDNTATFSADANIQDEKSTSFTADAIIENLDIDNAFSIDTNIQQLDIQTTFSIDTIISLQGDATFSVDATLKNSIETTFSVDTNILKADNTATFSADAILSHPMTFDIDTNLKKLDQSNTFTFSARIQEKQLDLTKTFLADALLVTIDEKNEVTTVVNDFDEILTAQGKQVQLIKREESYDSMNQLISQSNETKHSIRAVLFPQGQRNHSYNDIGNTAGGQQQAFFKDRYNVNGTIVVPKEGDEFIDPQGKKWRITELNEWVWSYEVIYVEATIENIDLTGTTR